MKDLILNWKLGLTHEDALKHYLDLNKRLPDFEKRKIVVCLEPITLGSLLPWQSRVPMWSQIGFGYQTGSFTGQVVLPKQVSGVLLGHSETRSFIRADWGKAAQKLLSQKKEVIFCLGESKEEFESHKTESKLGEELDQLFRETQGEDLSLLYIAYEPVWAIGQDIDLPIDSLRKTLNFIRERIRRHTTLPVKLYYGGNVNVENLEVVESLPVEGYLMGRVSLSVDSVLEILQKT